MTMPMPRPGARSRRPRVGQQPLARYERPVRRTWLLLPPLLLLLAAGCAARAGGGPGAPGGPTTGRAFPSLSVRSLLEPRTLRTDELRGRVLLVDIWASWCVPCKEELPLLDEVASRLRGLGVEILAVSIDDEREDALRFLRERGRPWTLTFAHDPDKAVPERLQPPKMPTSYVVDRKGVLREIVVGWNPEELPGLEARLRALAAE
jgi:thiol-disulfide isomerase/thioredoxin